MNSYLMIIQERLWKTKISKRIRSECRERFKYKEGTEQTVKNINK